MSLDANVTLQTVTMRDGSPRVGDTQTHTDTRTRICNQIHNRHTSHHKEATRTLFFEANFVHLLVSLNRKSIFISSCSLAGFLAN